MTQHSEIKPIEGDTSAGPHVVHYYTFANTTKMADMDDSIHGTLTASADDVGRIAKVGNAEPYSFYLLAGASPVAWQPMGSAGWFSPAGGVVATTGSMQVTGSTLLKSTLTVSGAAYFAAGLSGSLTRLTNGSSYLVAGTGMQIVTGSSGQVTITNSGSLQTAYNIGNTISFADGQSPPTIAAAHVTQAQSQVVLQTVWGPGSTPGLAVTPIGLTGATDILIAPDAQPDEDTNGYGVSIAGGSAGPENLGGALGGTVSLNAGQGNGGTAQENETTGAGNIRIGRDAVNEIFSGQETYGTKWTHTGQMVIAGGSAEDADLTVGLDLVVNGTTTLESLITNNSVTHNDDVTAVSRIFSQGGLFARATDRAVSTDVTLSPTADEFVRVSTASGKRTLTLPDPALKPKFYIKKYTTDANEIDLARYGSEQIEGAAATYLLPGSAGTGRPGWMVWSDGTNWWVVTL